MRRTRWKSNHRHYGRRFRSSSGEVPDKAEGSKDRVNAGRGRGAPQVWKISCRLDGSI